MKELVLRYEFDTREAERLMNCIKNLKVVRDNALSAKQDDSVYVKVFAEDLEFLDELFDILEA